MMLVAALFAGPTRVGPNAAEEWLAGIAMDPICRRKLQTLAAGRGRGEKSEHRVHLGAARKHQILSSECHYDSITYACDSEFF